MTRNAVYAGSFDPLTIGHLAILEAASKMFDRLYLIVTANPDKGGGRFPAHLRVTMAKAAVGHLPNVEVVNVHGQFIVQWAAKHDCGWMVRGLRGPADLDQERVIEKVNTQIVPGVQTVYIPAPVAVENVSSSLVMGLVGHAGWLDVVRPLVPEAVFRATINRHLQAYFMRLCERAGAVMGGEFPAIESAYSDKSRHYHTLEHIAEVLDLIDLHSDKDMSEAEALRFAVFYHDMVNGEGPKDESRSAEMAKAALIRMLKIQMSEVVETLVMATARGGANKSYQKGGHAARILVDADMAVLGRTPSGYDIYARQIRQEYARYSDRDYTHGRREFLATVLARPRIFATDEFFTSYEERARSNMERELAALKGIT